MTHYAWTFQKARKRYRCKLCIWYIYPGEQYWRMAVLDRTSAWTDIYCEHCERCANAYSRAWGVDEWSFDCIYEFLEEEYPDVWEAMRAGWSYPDGMRVPPPFQPRCIECRTFLKKDDHYLWCGPCDQRRIERISSQLHSLEDEFTRLAKT